MAGGERLAHARRQMGLADGDEGDAVRRPFDSSRGRVDPAADGGEIGGDNPFHGGSIPGTRLAPWLRPQGCRFAEDRGMSVAYYRLSVAYAASLSLAVAACATTQPSELSQPGAANAQQASTSGPSEMDTEATIWTLLGLAKKESERRVGPQTGSTVSPVLWQAALDTLDFVKFASEDPVAGSLVTDWYSPQNKPNERYKVNVFILSRALRSDAVAVTVTREARLGDGNWLETTIEKKVETDLETAILNRARQLKREWTATATNNK
jgi:hypothetical protein